MIPHGLTAARLRSLSRLARAYAHEIRGASSSLAIHTELLSGSVAEIEDEGIRSRQQRYVRVLASERQRVQRLIDQLLDAVVPLDDPAVEAFDLSEVLAGLHALLTPQATERRAPLDVAADGPLPMTGRRRLVEQAVLDVLLWAFDRVPAGARVDVVVAGEPERVRIVIDGAMPNVTDEESMDEELGACDALVRLAGGRVHSAPGDGRVEIELPRTGPAEEAHA
jgi:signal transduction histidine kinase